MRFIKMKFMFCGRIGKVLFKISMEMKGVCRKFNKVKILNKIERELLEFMVFFF